MHFHQQLAAEIFFAETHHKPRDGTALPAQEQMGLHSFLRCTVINTLPNFWWQCPAEPNAARLRRKDATFLEQDSDCTTHVGQEPWGTLIYQWRAGSGARTDLK